MKERKVEFADSVLEDIDEINAFLLSVMAEESAVKYVSAMRDELLSLSFLADCFQQSRSKQLLRIHPQARRMVSHNRKWQYVFHIEDAFVVIDRILPAKMLKE